MENANWYYLCQNVYAMMKGELTQEDSGINAMNIAYGFALLKTLEKCYFNNSFSLEFKQTKSLAME